MAHWSEARTIATVSANYVISILWPVVLAAGATAAFGGRAVGTAVGVAAIAWLGYCSADGSEFGLGSPDAAFSQRHWMFVRMRHYLKLTLHRTEQVQALLFKLQPWVPGVVPKPTTGQAIFAFFPHGVNSDFRVLMDGMLYDAFSRVYEKGAARTLSASILFKLPGIRSLTLRTACVDAGRATAEKCLRGGLSLLLCPGGQDEQIETIYGRERVFLKNRSGFVRLAIVHGVPLVPAYCFGSSDLYFTSRAAHGLRRWLVRNLRVAMPLYWGRWGFFAYPTPMGFPRAVPQHVVFGDPLRFEQKDEPTKADVAAAHAKFIAALTALFNAHKDEFGCAGRTLEVL